MGDRLIYIQGHPGLCCDKDTLIVYYVFWKQEGIYSIVTAMTPYLGEHGKPCRYEDGQIVEIF